MLFPVWTDTALRIALGLGALAVPAAFVVPMVYVRTPYNQARDFEVDQPVQFDHRHHVGDDGIACLYCHNLAETTASAGIPSTDVCMGCHSQVWQDSPMLAPVRESFVSGRPISWNRVHRVPDFVYFNHAVHVRGGIGCARCHGDVAAMPIDRQVAPLTMGFCLDCHRENRHRGEELTLDAAVPARGGATDGHRASGGAPLVAPLETCTACHR
jgi:hypothetical protein